MLMRTRPKALGEDARLCFSFVREASLPAESLCGDDQLSHVLPGELSPDTVLPNAVTKKHGGPESVWGSAVLNIQGGS